MLLVSRIPRHLLLVFTVGALALLSALPTPLTQAVQFVPVTTLHAQSACDGLVTPRLQNGGQARVITTYGLSLKNEPRTGAAGAVEVMLLSYDTVATVTGTYTCNLGYLWWPLLLPDGTTGWAAEGGVAGDYYMEPVTIGLHSFVQSADGTTITHYWVTPDGSAELRGAISIAPVETTPGSSWQLVEIDRLRSLLDNARNACPERLAGTAFEGGEVNAALKLALPTLDYDFYPAPNGELAVLVRHFHLQVPRCDTVIPERVGMSTVSVIDLTGSSAPDRELFPIPQHGSIPDSTDVYAETEPGEWSVYLEEVNWSPQSKYIGFVAAYRDTYYDSPCVRFHVYISNLETGELYALGEGRNIGWTNGGESINLYRLVFNDVGGQTAQLYTMRANGYNREEIWLPGGAVYVSDEQLGLGFPWNASGTRVMVANAGEGEVMLFDLATHDFTSRVAVPDRMPLLNRLAILLMRSESTYLWTTIRGDFAVQDVDTGDWTPLNSELASSGIAPRQIRAFADGVSALVEMVDGSAYILNIAADALTPVRYGA